MLSQGKILPTKVLIKEHEVKEQTTSSGIIMPETRKSPTISGKIVLVGTGTPIVPMSVEVGMNVLFSPLQGQRLFFEDSEYILLDQSNVLFMYPDNK